MEQTYPSDEHKSQKGTDDISARAQQDHDIHLRFERIPHTLLKVEVAPAEPAVQSFTLHLANGRAIESSFPLAEKELARLIRIAESA